MKHVFLDTNIVIDFLADRRPFSLDAAILFDFSLLGIAKMYISAVSYNNIYYVIRQCESHKQTIKLLEQLAELAEIIDVKKNIIAKSLKTEFNDFEDAIQYNCALSVPKIDIIVTRDTRDFKKSTLPVLTPREAVSLLKTSNK